MKKILCATLVFFALGISVMAQDTKTVPVQKNFILFSAGPSIPLADFGSADVNNSDAGMANAGFTIDLKYGHQFDPVFGLASTLVYGSHTVDKAFVNDNPDVSIDHWQYFSWMVGPMFTGKLTQKTSLDFSVLTGVALANSPKGKYNDQVVVTDDWSTAVPLKLASDFRFSLRNKGYLMAGVNYTYMKPKFNVTEINSETLIFKQKMHTFGINVGIGFGF